MHTLYQNFVLENKLTDYLETALNMQSFATVDYSLTEADGLRKTVHVYTADGAAQDLASGVGLTPANAINVAFGSVDYDVVRTQSNLVYTDDEEMKDPMVVEQGLKRMSDLLTNDLTDKVIAEMGNATLTATMTNWDFDEFADAIALYPYEDESGLFCLINPAEKATIRKALNDDLKYSEDFARKGYIGSVCGVPIYVSKAVPAGEAYLADKKAVTIFWKKGVNVEQDRNVDTKTNTVVGSGYKVVALTDATRVIKMA